MAERRRGASGGTFRASVVGLAEGLLGPHLSGTPTMRTHSSLAVSLLLAACGRSVVYEPLPPPETPEIPSELPEQCPPPPPPSPSPPPPGSQLTQIWSRSIEPSTAIGLDAEGRILSVSSSGTLRTYDPDSGALLAKGPAPFDALPQYSPTGDAIVISGGQGSPTVHHRRCGTGHWTDLPITDAACGWSAGCQGSISSDGGRLAVAAFDRIVIVDLGTDGVDRELVSSSWPIGAVAWGFDGRLFALISSHGADQVFAGHPLTLPIEPAVTLVSLDPDFNLQWASSMVGVWFSPLWWPGASIQPIFDGSIIAAGGVEGSGTWGSTPVGAPVQVDNWGIRNTLIGGFLIAAGSNGRPLWGSLSGALGTGSNGVSLTVGPPFYYDDISALGSDGAPLGDSVSLPFKALGGAAALFTPTGRVYFEAVTVDGTDRPALLTAFQLER